MARKMSTPASDPLQRGKSRSSNIDMDESVMRHVLERLKQEDSTDEETNWVNIRRILRAIPRNNPNDPFKPFSQQAIHELAQGCPEEPHELLPAEEEMIQHYGYDLDKCTIFDKPNPGIKKPEIPAESQFILNRYPAWLRTLIESRYAQLQKKYGSKTPIFLKMLGQRLEYQKTRHSKDLSDLPVGDTEDGMQYMQTDRFDVEDDYLFIGMDVKEAHEIKKQTEKEPIIMDPFRRKSVFDPKKLSEMKMKEEVEKRKSLDEARERFLWSPLLTHKAGEALRAALVAGASETEDEDYYEEGGDEATTKREREKGVVRHKDEEFVYRGDHWEAIVANESGFKEEAEEILNEEFMKPSALKEHRRRKRVEMMEQRKKERKTDKELRKAFRKKQGHPLLKQKGDRQKDAALYRERGVGKRPSRLFVRSPCDGPIVEVERNLHQTRTLEALRAYANWIAASPAFKYFIMIIIIGNAALLAFETGEYRNIYNYVFDILDSVSLNKIVIKKVN